MVNLCNYLLTQGTFKCWHSLDILNYCYNDSFMNWHSIKLDQAALFAFKTPFSIWYWCLHALSWSVSRKGNKKKNTVTLSHRDVIAKGLSPSPITSISVLFPAYETVQRWKQFADHPVKTLKWLPTSSMMYLHLICHRFL